MADSEPLAEWAWNETLASYGCELDAETLHRVLGLRVIDTAHLLCRRFDLPISPQEAMDRRERIFLDAVPRHLRPLPGLHGLLDALDTRQIPIGVATSGYRAYATLALRTLGVLDRFQTLATGDEVSSGKPAPDIYLLAADRLGVPRQRCMVLEDAPRGVAAARAAGMMTVAVPHPQIPLADFTLADWVLASLEDVRDALDDLLQADGLEQGVLRYVAAGGVVVRDGRVLVLYRPSRDEIRLPKGHVEPGETVEAAALREVCEESGCDGPRIEADLGLQLVEFDGDRCRVERAERYFLMTLADGHTPRSGESEFQPAWLTWEEALAALTFEPEREWLRRAKSHVTHHGS